LSKLPRIAIVGRPNVGKSTLLNRMVGSRVSIVEPSEGVTRDRVSVPVRLDVGIGERAVEVIDTGGIGIVDRDDLGPHVEQQIQVAIDTADLVLFMVDARSGVAPLDVVVAERLRGLAKPVLLLCNKVEGDKLAWEVDAFRGLGVGGDPLPISAQNGDGIERLYAAIGMALPIAGRDEVLPKPSLRLAIVGRRNAGKSTLVNTIAREERAIVSEKPGTTRDALDVIVERDGETFVVIDTAGVRKKARIADAVEFYSDARSHKAIRRADVVILLFDATERIADVEKNLARYARDHYKCLILGANKWDLVQGLEPEDFRAYRAQEFPGVAYAPIAFLSARDGFNVSETLALARELQERSQKRVSTALLNRVLKAALESRSPSSKGHRVRITYATQIESAPPTFVLFVNDKRSITKDYVRYLENRLREDLGFDEVPVHVILREKSGKEAIGTP
jgi:GTP-binding protein